MSDSNYDVAIVGYGPTGATAANLLGQLGLRVLVIERDPDIYGRARAISTDEEVMRIWQSVGLADRLQQDMLPDRPVAWVGAALPLPPPSSGGIVGVHTIGTLRREAFAAKQLGQYRLKKKLAKVEETRLQPLPYKAFSVRSCTLGNQEEIKTKMRAPGRGQVTQKVTAEIGGRQIVLGKKTKTVLEGGATAMRTPLNPRELAAARREGSPLRVRTTWLPKKALRKRLTTSG